MKLTVVQADSDIVEINKIYYVTDMRYVEVKEVLDLFDQLQSWDKVKFLDELGVTRNLDTYELRDICNRV